MSEPLLEIKNLVTGFETESGLLKAVDGVSFTVPKGTCVGIVGESGCGKSVTAMSIVRLLPQPMGKSWTGKYSSRAVTWFRQKKRTCTASAAATSASSSRNP